MTSRRSSWIFPAFALGHAAIFLGLFRTIYSIPFSGTSLYFYYAGKTLAGQLPYRDFVLEYPPVALAMFTLPRLIGTVFATYYLAFHVEILLFDLLILMALSYAAERWSLPRWRVLAAYSLAILAAGPISIQQFDIAPAAFTLCAIVAFADDREGLAAFFLALGVMTKVYPILLAPLFVLIAVRRGRLPRLVPAVSFFVITCILCVLPWLVRAPASLLTMLTYHAKRGIHVDSTWATVAYIERAFNLTWVELDFSYGSWNIVGPGVTPLVPISTIVLVIVLAASYWWIYRRLGDAVRDDRIDLAFLARASAVVILASMAASKVFSPQYVIWPIPLLVLVEWTRQRVALGLFVAIGAITYWGYPVHYQAYLDREPYMLIAFGLRNALVVALAVYLARASSGRPRISEQARAA